MTATDHQDLPEAGDTPSVVAAVTGAMPVTTTVTAIVVTHGVTPYLNQTLAAVRAGRVLPDSIVVIDTAATEETARYDDLHLGDARFVAAPRARSFGQAVDLVVGSGHGGTWLWLLHDDSAPEADALAELLRAVEPYDTIAIAGAKQRPWEPGTPGAERLLEVGVTTTAWGRRVTGIGPFDIDQGQLDARDDVLAVGLAGALVRRTAWERLGGTDPELGPFGDGLDLCVRARRAGSRVVVVPSAVVRHAQASYNGQRRDPSAPPRPDASFGARRRSQLHARLTSVAPLVLPVALIAMLLGAPLRAMYRLVMKQPRQARDELVAPLWALVRMPSVARARRRNARTAVVSRRSVRRDFSAPLRQVFTERRDRRSALAERARVADAPTQAELAELRAKAVLRRSVLAVVVVALAGFSALVFAPLIGPLADKGRLVGGALLPATTSLADVWRASSTGLIGTGLGQGAPADPFGWVLLAAAALAGGTAQTAVNVVVVLIPLIAGVGAWFAAGALTRSVAARAWVVLVWVAAPTLTQALSGGRLGALVVHAALPWFVLGAVRAVGAQRLDLVTTPSPEARSTRPTRAAGSWGAAAGAGLVLVVVAAGAPVLLPVVCVGLVVAALVTPRCRRYLIAIPVPALMLLAPFYVHVARTAPHGGWRALLADPGAPLASEAAPPWQMLLGAPTVPGPWFATGATGILGDALRWAPLAMGAVVLLLALWGVVRGTRTAILGWAVAALGIAVAVVAGATVVAPGAQGGVHGWPGAGLSLALVGLLGAAVAGLPRRPARAKASPRVLVRARVLGRGLLVAVLVALPVADLASWTVRTLDREGPRIGEVRVVADPVVPPVGQQMQRPPTSARVLAVLPAEGGGVDYALLRSDGSQLVDASAVVHQLALTDPSVAQGPLPEVVAQLMASSADDVVDRLGDLGVGAVLLPAGDASTDRAALTAHLDMVAGLERVTEGQSAVIWRVASGSEPSWAWIEDGADRQEVASEGLAVDTSVEAGAEDRVLLLAANAADGWGATLDGRRLEPVDPAETGGLQAFHLGGGGGHVEVSYAMANRTAWLTASGIVIVIYALLAVPIRRRRISVGEDE